MPAFVPFLKDKHASFFNLEYVIMQNLAFFFKAL